MASLFDVTAATATIAAVICMTRKRSVTQCFVAAKGHNAILHDSSIAPL